MKSFKPAKYYADIALNELLTTIKDNERKVENEKTRQSKNRKK